MHGYRELHKRWKNCADDRHLHLQSINSYLCPTKGPRVSSDIHFRPIYFACQREKPSVVILWLAIIGFASTLSLIGSLVDWLLFVPWEISRIFNDCNSQVNFLSFRESITFFSSLYFFNSLSCCARTRAVRHFRITRNFVEPLLRHNTQFCKTYKSHGISKSYKLRVRVFHNTNGNFNFRVN